MGVLDQYLAGREARRQQDAADQANAMQGFLQQNGQAIFAGDQNALGQLAGMGADGLTTAFNVQGNIDTRNRNARIDERADVTADREAWRFEKETTEYAKSISAEQAAKEAAAIENAIKASLAAETPQQFDALMDQLGQPELKGRFADREALAMQYVPMAEALKARASADPTEGAPTGKMWVDPKNRAAGVAPLPGMPDQTPAPFTPEGKLQADLDAGRITPEQYQAGLARLAKGSGTTINVGDGNSGAFDKKTAENAAVRFDGMVAEGQAAQSMMGDLSALAALAPSVGTGKTAEVINALGPYASALGVEIEGLAEGQAYKAIIDRLAPQMRPAGAGATSDFDARQFLSALPGLGKTPEGNAIISATLQALQQQKMAAAEIARKAQRGEIKWQEADEQIAALGNPYERFNKYKDVSGVNATGAGLSKEALDYLNTP